MPMLRCAFWLSIVYASILLHPAASTRPDAAEAVTGAVRDPGAAAGTAGRIGSVAKTTAATLSTICAAHAEACGVALDAARGDAAKLTTLFAGAAPDVPPLAPAPRRHARVRVLTPTP